MMYDNEPAFPSPSAGVGQATGLTVRDYLAAHAPPIPALVMDAFLACLKPELVADDVPFWQEYVLEKLATQERRWRYAYADAMLKGRNKPI